MSRLAIPDDENISPVKRLGGDEELEYDLQAYRDHPGAEDSEIECDDDDNLMGAYAEAAADRQLHDEEEEAAKLDTFVDIVASYQEEIRLQTEAEIIVKKEEDELSQVVAIPGAPSGWKPPSAPEDWQPSKVRAHTGEPDIAFADVDNPGGWSRFCFRPKYLTKKKKDVKEGVETEDDPEGAPSDKAKFLYYAMPTGATPVPLDAATNERKVAEYEFHYNGWIKPDNEIDESFRSGATRDNPFPSTRQGSLDGDKLFNLGLTKYRMENEKGLPDALFFFLLLLPLHDIKNNDKILTVPNDPRTSFYTDCSRWSNMYAAGELNILGTGYGHEFKTTTPTELLQWDGTIFLDGVLGGTHGAILKRFDKTTKLYDEDIASTFTKSRWLELKRVYKLCNNLTAAKKGSPGYNPAYKYDHIYSVIIDNVNNLTLFAGLDLCLDETTFAFNGWGESGSGLLAIIVGKPGVTRGGQIVIVLDVDRIRPRGYVHRHKLHQKEFSLPGPNEVRMIWVQMQSLFQRNEYRPRGIFREKPHFTCDNYFSGDVLLKYACKEGFGLTMTCRRDRLPKGIPRMHLHQQKTSVTPRSRAARFERPIFCIKEYVSGGNICSIQLTSFQSTSSCNIIHVNALNSLNLFSQRKERGRGNNKREWGIEMNESRQLYLKTYGKVDTMDHLIKNCNVSYRTWKHWHAPMLHAKAMAAVIAYDMYKECAEGNLRAGEWKIEKPVSFHCFRERLALQMIHYRPQKRAYPGDEHFRVSTQQHKKRRLMSSLSSGSHSVQSRSSSPANTCPLSRADFSRENDVTSRLCGDLTPLYNHLEACVPIPNGGSKICVLCGEKCYWVCMECKGPDGKRGVAMHKNPKKEGTQLGAKVTCFYHHHNTAFFGLAKNDHRLLGVQRKKDWSFPTKEKMSKHRSAVERILQPAPTPGVSTTTAPSRTGRNRPTNVAASLAVANTEANYGNDNTSGDNQRRVF